jgi:HEAT repeats
MSTVESLLSAVASADELARRDALRQLVQLGPAIAGELVAAWRGESWGTADRLASVFLRWPADAAVAALEPLLADSTPGLAVHAVAILGRMHHDAAVRPLVAALDQTVQRAAVRALGNNGMVQAIAPLRGFVAHLIGDCSDVRSLEENDLSATELVALGIQSLGQLGDDSLSSWLPAIVRESEEPSAQEVAVAALGDVPVADALDTLASVLAVPGSLPLLALRTLWSYRTIEAVDVVANSPVQPYWFTDVAAMLYDVAALDVSGREETLRDVWASRRAELAAHTCLLAGEPITITALLDRIRTSTRLEQAVHELELCYGFRPRWAPPLDAIAELLVEAERWAQRASLHVIPGRMYRFGHEVPASRLPRHRLQV